MVASAKFSVKRIHPQEGSNKQKEPFFILFITQGHKISHNSAVVGCTEFSLCPSCSSHDSASDEISVIDIKKMADRVVKAKLDFDEKPAALLIAS